MSRPIKIWMEGAVLRWSGLTRGVRFVQCAWPPHGGTLEGADIRVVCEVKTNQELGRFVEKLTAAPSIRIEVTLPGMVVAATPSRLEITRQRGIAPTWRVTIDAVIILQGYEPQAPEDSRSTTIAGEPRMAPRHDTREVPWEPLSDDDLAVLLYGPRQRRAQED